MNNFYYDDHSKNTQALSYINVIHGNFDIFLFINGL